MSPKKIIDLLLLLLFRLSRAMYDRTQKDLVKAKAPNLKPIISGLTRTEIKALTVINIDPTRPKN
jgi:hypothetical protein